MAVWASGKFPENVVRNGVDRYEALFFLGLSQEPLHVNTAKTWILWVWDVSSQTSLVASKYSKTCCFCCFTPKKPNIATLYLKVPHTCMTHMDVLCIYIYAYLRPLHETGQDERFLGGLGHYGTDSKGKCCYEKWRTREFHRYKHMKSLKRLFPASLTPKTRPFSDGIATCIHMYIICTYITYTGMI